MDRIAAAGGLMETCSERLLGIDVENWEQAVEMRELLDELGRRSGV